MGARWELDDRMTAYDAEGIASGGLDGGKVLLRIADDDAGTAPTLEACARAVSALARRAPPDHGRAAAVPPRRRRCGPACWTTTTSCCGPSPWRPAIGTSSAYTWLKVPAGPRAWRAAVGDDAAGAAPGRSARPRARGHVRRLGGGDDHPQRSRPGRRPGAALPARRRRRRGHRAGGPHRATRSVRMADLHRPAGTLAAGADPVALGPEQAGWAYSGLRVLHLADGRAAGHRHRRRTRWPSCPSRRPTWRWTPTGSTSSWTAGRASSRG